MNILVAYATHSSSTQLASQTVVDTLTKYNHTVIQKDISEVNPDELSSYDLIVLGSPTWFTNDLDGQPHEFFLDFIEKMKGKILTGKQFAIFGLGDRSYTKFCGAVDVLTNFVKDIQGNLIVEPIKIDGYYYDQDNNTELLIKWTEDLAQKLQTHPK